LLKMINSGKLRAGDSLPGEEELGHVYGVSRMTSRQALQVLKQQGFASRQRGRGTFVTQPKVEKDITHLSGFTAEMHRRAAGCDRGRLPPSRTVSRYPKVRFFARLSLHDSARALRYPCELGKRDSGSARGYPPRGQVA
jgi:GntR family transcriptional regulator